MVEFFDALWRHTFLQNALLVGALASIACGVVGTYVTARRITYIAGGISHSILGGMGVAYYLKVVHGWESLEPLHGATVSALLAAVVIGWVSLKAKEREDTVIGAVWAIGMAIGIIFIAKTPGYSENLMSYLFGNILLVSSNEVILIALLDLIVIAVALLFYHQLLAVCYDEEFARVRGLKVEFYYLLLLCLTSLTVVLLVTVVGIVMVIALLTLPIAVAGQFTKTLAGTMALSTLLSVIFVSLGLAISYTPSLPAGATVILLSGAVFLLVTMLKPLIVKVLRRPAV